MNVTSRLIKRKIEVEAIKPLLQRLEKMFSVDDIKKLLVEINEEEAFIRGRNAASHGGCDVIKELRKDVDTWGDGGYMDIDFIEQTETTLYFDVKACPYQKLYEELNMKHFGFAFSCCRDEPFARGLNSKLKLNRSKTLMESENYCDFRYELAD